jgi:hypothetical protein
MHENHSLLQGKQQRITWKHPGRAEPCTVPPRSPTKPRNPTKISRKQQGQAMAPPAKSSLALTEGGGGGRGGGEGCSGGARWCVSVKVVASPLRVFNYGMQRFGKLLVRGLGCDGRQTSAQKWYWKRMHLH